MCFKAVGKSLGLLCSYDALITTNLHLIVFIKHIMDDLQCVPAFLFHWSSGDLLHICFLSDHNACTKDGSHRKAHIRYAFPASGLYLCADVAFSQTSSSVSCSSCLELFDIYMGAAAVCRNYSHRMEEGMLHSAKPHLSTN